jgi:hypothetical protein
VCVCVCVFVCVCYLTGSGDLAVGKLFVTPFGGMGMEPPRSAGSIAEGGHERLIDVIVHHSARARAKMKLNTARCNVTSCSGGPGIVRMRKCVKLSIKNLTPAYPDGAPDSRPAVAVPCSDTHKCSKDQRVPT